MKSFCRLLVLCTVLTMLFMGNAYSQEAKTIKIAAWNLEHFVDPYNDPYIDNPKEDSGAGKSAAVLTLLAESIKNMNPDVIVFTETESDRAIKLFLDSFMPGHDYKYFGSVADMTWYQNVVVASRYPLGEIVSLREVEMYNEVLDRTENKYNSRLLLVEVNPTPDYSILLAGLHLKAGGDPEDPVWRTKQIEVIDKFLAREKKIDPERNIIILGDMNFAPDTEEYKTMTTGGPFPLYDPFAEQGHPFSHPSSAPRWQIDHIFISEGMKKEYVPGSAKIEKPIAADQLPSISDHLPVSAEFYIGDK